MTRIGVLVVLGLAHTAAAAVQLTLDPRAVSAAIAIGQSRIDRDRTAFHAPYRIRVDKPPVDYVDVVTPFRRIVMAAQARAEIGDRLFGQRHALEMLTDPPEVELWVELTFHPLNTFVGVPAYDVWLEERPGVRIPPRGIERRPRHGLRVQNAPLPVPVPGGLQLPETSEPLVGGTVVARFDGRLLEPAGVYSVIVEETGKELARARVDLGKLR